MGSEGWIKLHREIFDSDIWNDVTTFRLFIYLIGKASHQNGLKHKGMTLNKGQYVRSYRKLADDLSYKEGRGFKKYSLSTIKSCVNKLTESERVNVNETELGTLFTIVNYAKYQHLDEEEKESENTINDEARTNAELTPNEVRTNAEQEQELKNLRIKELNTTTTTTREENSENDAIVFYQNNFGSVTPYVSNDLLIWLDDLSDELVIEAMKRAMDRNKRNWGYVKSILQSWLSKNIKTVAQAKAEEVEFQNQQQAKRTSRFQPRQPQNKEIVPEWFKKQKEAKNQQPVENDDFEQDELAALLQKHASGEVVNRE